MPEQSTAACQPLEKGSCAAATTDQRVHAQSEVTDPFSVQRDTTQVRVTRLAALRYRDRRQQARDIGLRTSLERLTRRTIHHGDKRHALFQRGSECPSNLRLGDISAAEMPVHAVWLGDRRQDNAPLLIPTASVEGAALPVVQNWAYRIYSIYRRRDP